MKSQPVTEVAASPALCSALLLFRHTFICIFSGNTVLSLARFRTNNVMLDEEGTVDLIDFSYAGRLNDPVPSHIPQHIYGSSHLIHALADEQRLESQF